MYTHSCVRFRHTQFSISVCLRCLTLESGLSGTSDRLKKRWVAPCVRQKCFRAGIGLPGWMSFGVLSGRLQNRLSSAGRGADFEVFLIRFWTRFVSETRFPAWKPVVVSVGGQTKGELIKLWNTTSPTCGHAALLCRLGL